MNNKDWVPRSHEERYDQTVQTLTYLTTANITRMGLTGFQTWISNTLYTAHNTF
jgi:hypothetical protein